jgi:hypothetical protein
MMQCEDGDKQEQDADMLEDPLLTSIRSFQ